MKNKNVFIGVGIIALVLFAGGFFYGRQYQWKNFMVVKDHTFEEKKDTMDAHAVKFEVPANVTAPTVKITVEKDKMSGYNLHAVTTNYKFTPEKANLTNVMGEGHAHIYVDGVKLTRLYGDWYYIGHLEPGVREIKVSLNGNDHAAYYANGKEIADTVKVEVEQATGEADHHE